MCANCGIIRAGSIEHKASPGQDLHRGTLELSVIVTVYQKEFQIGRIVEGIVDNTAIPFELVIVYDGCTDGSEARVEEVLARKQGCMRKLTVLHTPDVNETRANNAGMKAADGDFFILVQDDMLVLEKGWDKRLLAPMLRWPDVFAVSARNAHNHRLGQPGDESVRTTCTEEAARDVFKIRFAVNRGPLALHAHTVRRLDYLDEAYAPLYFDDMDLCVRAYRDLGKVCGVYGIGWKNLRGTVGSNKKKPLSTGGLWQDSCRKNLRIFWERYHTYLQGDSEHDEDRPLKSDSHPDVGGGSRGQGPLPEAETQSTYDLAPARKRSLNMQLLGTDYGGWAVDCDLIPPGSTVISAGVGEDISFDLRLIELRNCTVVGVDPTQKAGEYVRRMRPRNFEFMQKALHAQPGRKVRIYRNGNPEHVSESILPTHRSVRADDYYEAETVSLSQLLQTYPNVSVLKMDIEGAEYDILNSLETLTVPQLCVEFHHPCTHYTIRDTMECIKHLGRLGYVCAHTRSKAGPFHEATFVHRDCLAGHANTGPQDEEAAPQPKVSRSPVKKDDAMNETPVALVCYNRPWHTAQVLKAMCEQNVQNLYIFIDGPKTQADVEKISLIRKLAATIKWTRPQIVCQETNRGLARSVVGAVDHVMQFHDRIILLEDDCVPGRYFFDFVKQCLARYENHEKIFGINGYTVPVPKHLLDDHPYDCYFYPRIGSWGWATWKRAWRHFDPDLSKLLDRARSQNVDLTQGGRDIPAQVQRVLNGHDAWTLNWVLATYLNGGCYVYPIESHIQNIGFDGSGTNFGTSRSKFENATSARRPTRYPADIVINQKLIDHYNGYFEPKASKTVSAAKPQERSTGKRRLSIVHVNTHDAAGGAAKVGFRLAEAQRKQGHDAFMLTGVKNCDSPYTFAFDAEHKREILEHCRRQGLLYYESQGSHRLVQNELVRRADIVHLHNLHGYYFNPFSLSALSYFKPVVWTLHDMQAFTGHCSYSLGCNGWQRGCSKCEHLHIPPEIPVDTAARLLADKKLIYDHSRLCLVAPSRWLKDMIERSVLKGHPVELIYNGIDTCIFKPSDRLQARREFGIPPDAVAIGAAANGGPLGNPFKGGQYTQAVLKTLSSRLSNCAFVNIGGTQHGRQGNIINIPRIEDEGRLALAYSALDAFLYTPVADNCPLVVLEALACGVPVATFDTGGVGELVRDGIDGFVVGFGDVGRIVEAVEKIVRDPELRTGLAANARRRATETYDHAIVAQRYERLYERVLAECASQGRVKMLPLDRIPEIIKTDAFLASENRKQKGAVTIANSAAKQPAPEATGYDVSIVVGTKNRARLLDQMLASLKEAARGIAYEVIVIEGGSTDDTLTVLQRHGIKKVYSEGQCLGPGKHSWSQVFNLGFSKARGKWAMYGSDDILYSRDCLARAVQTLDRQGPEIAAGLFFYKNVYTRPDWDRFGIDFTYGEKLLMNYGLFRLDCFREVGGLNEQYQFYCGDGDLCYKFYSSGRQFIVLPECFIVHNNVLDLHKQEHADISLNDIALYKNNWKHYVSMDLPHPRRLLWHEDYVEALDLPRRSGRVGPGVEHYWRGLACFQYGLFENARGCFERAIVQQFDHELVRWFLAQSEQRCAAGGTARMSAIADEFVAGAAPRLTEAASVEGMQSFDVLDEFQRRGLWRAGEPLRLHLGCGRWRFEGYVNIDYPPGEHKVLKELGADYHADITRLNFPDQSVDEIRLHHVFEHFSRVVALAMLIRWHQWLRPGGTIRIETPDLVGSARTLLSNASWKTKMGVVRHLAGDQAAAWAYHVDQWFAERFDHTLTELGFADIRTNTSSWPGEPYLSNVEVVAVKRADVAIERQLERADRLLWESAVSEKERPTWQVWRQQLREFLHKADAESSSDVKMQLTVS